MSIAVAVRKGNEIVVATDTQENFGDRKILRAAHVASKILLVGSTYVAMTGWGLYDNILRDYLARMKRPRLGSDREVFSFFVAFWRQLHKRYSFVNDPVEEQEPSLWQTAVQGQRPTSGTMSSMKARHSQRCLNSVVVLVVPPLRLVASHQYRPSVVKHPPSLRHG